MMRKIFNRVYDWVARYKPNGVYGELGINRMEVRRLQKEKGFKKTSLFGVDIEITNFFWYLHGLNEIFLENTYLFNTKKKEPIILDCGANIGLSVIYFKRMYPRSKVLAFEPDNAISEILHSNLTAFNIHDVEIIRKAVWIEDTVLKFKSDGSVGGQIVTTDNNSVDVDAVRLNNYLTKEVDFLKIDIEGVEYEVLKDCADNLVNVKNIFIEYHSSLKNEQKLDEILFLLKNAGFKYYIKEAWNNMPMPFVDKRTSHYDLQLNIFGYRL